MTKLQELQQLCKGSVSININPHRDIYANAVDYLDDSFQGECKESTDKIIYDKMIEMDTIVELQYYPNTPIGFNIIWHYDVELAIIEALKDWE